LRVQPRGDRASGYLDRRGSEHVALGSRAGLLDLAHLRDHAVIEGADRLVVRADR